MIFKLEQYSTPKDTFDKTYYMTYELMEEAIEIKCERIRSLHSDKKFETIVVNQNSMTYESTDKTISHAFIWQRKSTIIFTNIEDFKVYEDERLLKDIIK